MLYDQGIVVETSKFRFYANFKYTLKKDEIDLLGLRSLSEASYDSFNSLCFQTMPGLVQQKGRPETFKCFIGEKTGKQAKSPEE